MKLPLSTRSCERSMNCAQTALRFSSMSTNCSSSDGVATSPLNTFSRYRDWSSPHGNVNPWMKLTKPSPLYCEMGRLMATISG